MSGCIRTDFQFRVAALIAVLPLSLGACSSTKTSRDMLPRADMAVEVGGPEAVVFPDVKADGVQDGRATEASIPDTQGEVPGPACSPSEGCFLDKCTENGQCQSGWCVEHLGEGVCSQVCQDECPAGWSCKQVAGTDPDVVFICVSEFANLCRPCSSGADCKSVGGVDDVCVDYGPDGDFCGGACQEDDDCPWGFSCKDGKTVEGADVKQCVADTGTCPCTAKSVALAATTTCKAVNAFGECPGTRICTAEGLTTCDAAEPAEESCNGIDDDCDGETDMGTCDDGNPCTVDDCAGVSGCQHEVLDVGECLDGNPCTVADHCSQGVCLGDPVICEDGNPCTDNVCTPNGGCDYPANQAACDDADPCTIADGCKEGECTGLQLPCDCQSDDDCAALDDGNLCTGTPICSTSELPFQCEVDPTTIINCPQPEGPLAVCLKAECDPTTGACSFVPDHDGWPCEDGDLCTVGGVCAQGNCTPGMNIACGDGNPCTTDSCVPTSGCGHVAVPGACEDGNPCTLGDKCVEGLCMFGKLNDCNDANPCTEDGCDPAIGCFHEPVAGECSDSNICTVKDTCQAGLCLPGETVSCEDGNLCTDDSCDPMDGCKHLPNAVACEDDNPCTTADVCLNGSCSGGQPIPCDDANPCTTDSCEALLGCVHTLNTAKCEDGNLCTGPDVCQNGLCVPGGAVSCNDANPCTTDTCAPQAGCLYALLDNGTVCGIANQICQDGKCTCVPDCKGKNCGTDGCTGTCGNCTAANQTCKQGTCACVGAKCGALCCAAGEACTPALICCKTACSGKSCGDNGCGGTCGACVPGSVCVNGQCVECDDGNMVDWDGCTQGKISEFRVNTQWAKGQEHPVVAALADGGFVVLWDSDDQDGAYCGVFGQRFNAQGAAAGPEFQVNSYWQDDQDFPALVALPGGGFVAVWRSYGQDGNGWGIFGQRFDAAGAKVGAEFQVNTANAGHQIYPSGTALDAGRYVIVWQGYGGNWSPMAQFYSANGSKEGNEFQVNTNIPGWGNEGKPKAVSLKSGDVFVAWECGFSNDGDSTGVYGQLLKKDGAKWGSEFLVNTYTLSSQNQPCNVALPDGRFLAAWASYNQDGSGPGIFTQLFNADGSKSGQEFRANEFTMNDQSKPGGAALPDNRFVIAWQGQGSTGTGIWLQRFNSDGSKNGAEFRANQSASPPSSNDPEVASLAGGSFVVVWSAGSNQDGQDYGIFAQRFDGDGKKLYH